MSIEKILNRELSIEELNLSQEIAAQPSQLYNTVKHSVLIFEIAGQLFGIKTSHILKVIPTPKLQRVPHRNSTLCPSFFVVDGEVLVAVEIASILETPSIQNTATQLLILATETSVTGFQVERVVTIEELVLDQLAPLPSTSRHIKSGIISGLFEWHSQAVAMLNFQRVDKSIVLGLQ